MRAAIVTPVQMVTISTTPSTQPRRVVCRYEKPKDETMIERWFVREFGILSSAANSANSQVLGSSRASIILVNEGQAGESCTDGQMYVLLLLEVLVLDTGLVLLERQSACCMAHGV